MDHKAISAWLRQTKHKAAKKNILSNITINDLDLLLKTRQNLCAYCDGPAEVFDHIFPLKSGAPNVIANILPTCKSCKKLKIKHADLVDLYTSGNIAMDRYLSIIQNAILSPNGDLMKTLFRDIIGL